MATTYKVLGQVNPSTTTNFDLYTVPSATQAVISTISITNVTAALAAYTIYVRPNGGAASTANCLAWDVPIPANSVTALTIGITVDATDVITVKSSVANALTFQAFGSEIA